MRHGDSVTKPDYYYYYYHMLIEIIIFRVYFSKIMTNLYMKNSQNVFENDDLHNDGFENNFKIN